MIDSAEVLGRYARHAAPIFPGDPAHAEISSRYHALTGVRLAPQPNVCIRQQVLTACGSCQKKSKEQRMDASKDLMMANKIETEVSMEDMDPLEKLKSKISARIQAVSGAGAMSMESPSFSNLIGRMHCAFPEIDNEDDMVRKFIEVYKKFTDENSKFSDSEIDVILGGPGMVPRSHQDHSHYARALSMSGHHTILPATFHETLLSDVDKAKAFLRTNHSIDEIDNDVNLAHLDQQLDSINGKINGNMRLSRTQEKHSLWNSFKQGAKNLFSKVERGVESVAESVKESFDKTFCPTINIQQTIEASQQEPEKTMEALKKLLTGLNDTNPEFFEELASQV